MLGTPGIRHVKNCHLGGRQDISVLVSGDHRRFSGNRPCPAGRRFCKQAWCPPSLAGVSAGQRGAHATCAVCPHAPHWLRAASYVRSGHCSRVYALGCSRARCSCVVVTLARLGVTIFVSWLGVRCRAVTRPGLARHFFAPPSCAPAVAVSVVYSHPLQPRRFTRACPSAESSFPRAIPSALMRGHTHAQEGLSLLPTSIRVPRACPRAGKGRSRRSICPNVVASMPCAGKGPQALREYWSEGIGSLGSAPRADDSPNALRSPQRSSTGGRVEGSSTATWATCAAANSAPVSASKALYRRAVSIFVRRAGCACEK